MKKTSYKVLGVMSGTSLDGLDIAYLHFHKENFWTFEIEKSKTYSYSESWIELLKDLVFLSEEKLKTIDNTYTIYLSEIINDFIKTHNITNIDAICSHGHTALHRPEMGLTYQIGNQKKLANLTNQKVVCDFRIQDVELGGQGAPLVPIGDSLLFSDYDFCLNLGGFANISTVVKDHRIAYDICPVNIVLNHLAKQLGLDYDDCGKIASSGSINDQLLNQLNRLDFYSKTYPKSLGLEWVNEQVFPILFSYEILVKDVMRTFVEHIAIQIADEVNKKQNVSLLITGGGVYNIFLIDRIRNLAKVQIKIPSKNLIEYKEALIFGLLGVLKLRQEVNCLSSVTGSSKDHSSGKIYLP